MVDLPWSFPADPSVQSLAVVRSPPEVELSSEMGQGPEPSPTHEFLRQNPMESFDLPSTPWAVGPPVNDLDALFLAEPMELLRDEAAPIVDVDRLGLPPALEGPPQVDRLLRSLSQVSSCHHEEGGPVVQDRVDVDLPLHPSDAERIDVGLPERVHLASLESLERLGFADNAHHESMPLEDPMDGSPTPANPSASEYRVDPHRSPRGVLAAQVEDAMDQVPVDPVGAPAGTTGLVTESLYPFFSIVMAPTLQGAPGDPEEFADLRGADSLLYVLLDRLQSETHIFFDQVDPFPGGPYVLSVQGARCRVNAHLVRSPSTASRRWPNKKGAVGAIAIDRGA